MENTFYLLDHTLTILLALFTMSCLGTLLYSLFNPIESRFFSKSKVLTALYFLTCFLAGAIALNAFYLLFDFNI